MRPRRSHPSEHDSRGSGNVNVPCMNLYRVVVAAVCLARNGTCSILLYSRHVPYSYIVLATCSTVPAKPSNIL